jgi:hypothetical protein
LSYPAWFSLHGGPYFQASVHLLLSFLALGFSLWRMPRTPSGFAARAVVMYFVLFLFSFGSFCSYYYMVVGLLCMALPSATQPAPKPKYRRFPDAAFGYQHHRLMVTVSAPRVR